MTNNMTHAELLRLSALDRAITSIGMTAASRPTIERIFDDAEKIERWLKKAQESLT